MHVVYFLIGPSQVTSSALAFAQAWVIKKEMAAEHEDIWKDAYHEKNERELLEDENCPIIRHI